MSAIARVSVTVEVEIGTWSDSCPVGQVYDQAGGAAVEIVRKALELDKRARVIGPVDVLAVITKAEMVIKERPI